MPRFIIQRVQEVVVEAANYPQAVSAMRELNQAAIWEGRKAATFVLPGILHDARDAEYVKGRGGVQEAWAYVQRRQRERDQFRGLSAELGLS